MATQKIKYMDKHTLTQINQTAIQLDLSHWVDPEVLEQLEENHNFPVAKIVTLPDDGVVITVLVGLTEYVEVEMEHSSFMDTFLTLPETTVNIFSPTIH